MPIEKYDISNNTKSRGRDILAEFDRLINWIKGKNAMETAELLELLMAPIYIILSGKGALKHPTKKSKSLLKKAKFYVSTFKNNIHLINRVN